AMAALLLSASVANGQKKPSALLLPSEASNSVRLKLIDGSNIAVDEAWETEQGIWYRRGGMSHLITRDRIKRIERESTPRAKANAPVAKVEEVDNSDQLDAVDGPVWIYLVGGARVEADSVTE